MISLQAKIAALKAGDYDTVLKGTEFDRDAIFTDSDGNKYTGCDNLVDIDYSLKNASKVIVLEEQVRVLREALQWYADVVNHSCIVTQDGDCTLWTWPMVSDQGKKAVEALAATDMGE